MAEKVILVLGPTAAGKTEAAICLAKALGTEVISADSMQVYRHMDIGTGKPSALELREIRHHMIDIVEPSEGYSVGRYMEDIQPIIEGLHSAGKIPIIAGGTGLYSKAMTRGLFTGPAADWGLREQLLEAEAGSPGFLHARLMALDPEAATGISHTDIRRTVRALEVCLKSKGGDTMSEMQRGFTQPLPFEFIKLGITRQREELYKLIDERVEKMFEAGLLEEVKRVLQMSPERTAMQAIGYKEVAAALEGSYSMQEATRLVKRNTRRYAKRQFTWFNAEADIHWFDITGSKGPCPELEGMLSLLRDTYQVG